jgi:hypothetical protein
MSPPSADAHWGRSKERRLRLLGIPGKTEDQRPGAARYRVAHRAGSRSHRSLDHQSPLLTFNGWSGPSLYSRIWKRIPDISVVKLTFRWRFHELLIDRLWYVVVLIDSAVFELDLEGLSVLIVANRHNTR